MKKDIDQIIEEALKVEPEFKLNKDFRNSVFKALRKKDSLFQKKIYFLIALGVMGMITVGIFTISYFIPGLLDFKSISGTSTVDSLVPIAILIGVMLVFIQFLDKRLIKDRYLSH